MALWDKLLKKQVICDFYEDNQAAVQILRSGRNPSLRHIGRTHKISLKWLSEVLTNNPQFMRLSYCDTKDMCADIFTKAFSNPEKYQHALQLISHYFPQEVNKRKKKIFS